MTELSSLVERSRKRDLTAFRQLVQRFQDMAHGYAYSILGDFHLAEDAAQEAFVDAYYKLDALREPAAFPGWFRRIVFKHVDRIIRKKEVATVPLEKGTHVPQTQGERSELQERVLSAIRGLPERQREATTLYYINGYSQNEIAEFLEVPVTTVRKRLQHSRKNLKERMIGMVEETLKSNTPDERFSQKVIEELLERPDFVQIDGHPVNTIVEAIRAALSEFEHVEGEEAIEDAYLREEMRDKVYRLVDGRALRADTTVTALKLASGSRPPIRLVTAGRVFRPDTEAANRSKVFHQLEGLHIGDDVTTEFMKETVTRAVRSCLPSMEICWEPDTYAGFESAFSGEVNHQGERIDIFGCGMMTAETLEGCGFDPDVVRGYSFGMGLERLAMLKLGITDIHALRGPPYAPPS